MIDAPTGNIAYCLHVIDVCHTDKADIITFDFGVLTGPGDIPVIIDKLHKKQPFILKQSGEAAEKGIAIYPYGTVVQPVTTEMSAGIKLQVVPCGNISNLPDKLITKFKENGYLESDDAIIPSNCNMGEIYTVGMSDGT